jgi:hypothetical protein
MVSIKLQLVVSTSAYNNVLVALTERTFHPVFPEGVVPLSAPVLPSQLRAQLYFFATSISSWPEIHQWNIFEDGGNVIDSQPN